MPAPVGLFGRKELLNSDRRGLGALSHPFFFEEGAEGVRSGVRTHVYLIDIKGEKLAGGAEGIQTYDLASSRMGAWRLLLSWVDTGAGAIGQTL
jgi:hypothetical protein